MGYYRGFKGGAYDAMIQARCKRTTLATIAKHLIRNEVFFNSRSMLARLGLELAEKLIVIHEGAVPVKNLTDADEWLGKFGIPRESLNTAGHGLHRYVRALQEENAAYECGVYAEAGFDIDGLEPEPERVTPRKRLEDLSPEQQAAAQDVLERKAEERAQRDRDRKIQLGEIKLTGVPIAEDWPEDEPTSADDDEAA